MVAINIHSLLIRYEITRQYGSLADLKAGGGGSDSVRCPAGWSRGRWWPHV